MNRDAQQARSIRFAEWVAALLARFLPPRALRRVYRAGHVLMRVVWRFTKPHSSGAKVAVIRDGEVLLVRHTYGARRWDLPGGTARTGEGPAQTAARELREETGLGGQLRPLRTLEVRTPTGSGTVHGFALVVGPGVEPTDVDDAEIAELRWFARDRLPTDLAGGCRALLEAVSP